MKRWWPLVVLGVAAYLAFALATLPAQVVLARLQSSDFHAAGVSGTVWNGQAQVLIVGGVRVGALEWDLHVLPLLTGRASADVRIKRVDGFVDTELSAAPTGRISLADLTGSVPLSALPANLMQGGWAGTVNLRLASLVIEDGWPVAALGTIEVRDVTGPVSKPVNMGSYRATFPEGAVSEGVLTGELVDLGGPLQFNGSIELRQNDRSYHIEGMIGTRPDAPREVVDALRFLGPADEQGRRPFGTEGTL